MNIFSKLTTALRGGVRETAEVVIDANSMRIFSQEMHECENHITQSKQHLASIIAEKMQVKRDITITEKEINKYEEHIATQLKNEDEDQAMRLAKLIANKEAVLDRQQHHCQQLTEHESQLQSTLKNMIERLDNYRAEYRMAKATENLQSAQGKLASQNKGVTSSFTDMHTSLVRIKKHQQQFADQMNAIEQVDTYLTDPPIDEASLQKPSAKEIVERVRRMSSSS